MSAKRHGFDDNIMEFAVRFADLRHSKDRGRERVKSFKQISDEIFKKTGVYISHTQLSKYENMEDGDKKLIYPKINIILAIADYYEVSVEYLMGLTDSKSNDSIDKYTSARFGLSDKSMELLRVISRRVGYFSGSTRRIGNRYVSPELVNFIFENENFWDGLDRLLCHYFGRENYSVAERMARKQARANNPDSERDDENTASARYALIRHFERLLDDIDSSCEFIPPNIGHERDNRRNRGIPHAQKRKNSPPDNSKGQATKKERPRA